MSWQATNWAAQQQIVTKPADRHVLVILANSADANGRHAFPAISSLSRATGYSERSVQRILRRLVDVGAIRLGDQRIAAVHIERADRRPSVYDLAVENIERGDPVSPRGGEKDPQRGDTGSPRGPERGDTENRTGCQNEPNGVTGVSPDKPLNKNNPESAREAASEPDGSPPRAAPGEKTAGADPGAEAASLGEGEDAAEAVLDHDRIRDEIRIVVDWVVDGGAAIPWALRRAAVPDYRPGMALTQSAIAARIEESFTDQAVKKTASWVGWAEDVIDKRPDVKPPIADVARLCRALDGSTGWHAEFARARAEKLTAIAQARKRATATAPPQETNQVTDDPDTNQTDQSGEAA